MSDVQERRAQGTPRVPVSTLVEICGNVPGTPVFEAESVDVSPRGMHLKTAYLPEAGAPLVCRFENERGEIVVEGVVAWRREGGRGGEFGVQFTALDSRSVDALRDLCGPVGGSGESASPDPGGQPGARVRLHIDGLGSPMKARVKTGGSGKVQVGSSLEFLKVGRRLEIEDMDQGARRGAQIDGVSVMVDPSTQVPQLIVALRYEGAEENTPSPTVAPVKRVDQPAARVLSIPPESVTVSAPKSLAPSSRQETAKEKDRDREDKDDSEPKTARAATDDDEPMLRGRVATLASNAEVHAKAAGERLASASGEAARWFKGAADKVLELGRRRPQEPQRRTTSPAPQSSAEKPKLREQNPSRAAAGPEDKAVARKRLVQRATVAIAAAGVIGIATAATVMRAPATPPPGAASEAGSAVAAVEGAPLGEQPGAATNGGPVTANVPLFGPTALTTTEPAPLGPPPENASDEEQERYEARTSVPSGAEDDQDFADEKPARKSSRSQLDERPSRDARSTETRPEDVAPWGRGRMHLPTIHRLRLDAPGAAIQGAADPTGFTIVIPGRKVMEAAAGIAKRDERIARVRATNIGSGAQVSFRFKDGVPAYRVRLRRDYIEFLVSAPEAKGSKKSSADKSSR